MNERVAIVAAQRTPIGKFLGVFSDLRAVDLGRTAIAGALGVSQLAPSDVQEVICLLYTSPSPRDRQKSRMPSSA